MDNYSIFDIAAWFTKEINPSEKKLQKLLYYSEAWCNALYNKSLFKNVYFIAAPNGPMTPQLSNASEKNTKEIKNDKVIQLLQSIIETYGYLSENELEVISRKEQPWRSARIGYAEGEPCENKISKTEMKSYYRAIYKK